MEASVEWRVLQTWSPRGLEWARTKSYLLMDGPYAWSRHPMYVSETILLLGWTIFYGSLEVLIWTIAWCAWFAFKQMPDEERLLEARYGETYRLYKSRVRRWLGRVDGSSGHAEKT